MYTAVNCVYYTVILEIQSITVILLLDIITASKKYLAWLIIYYDYVTKVSVGSLISHVGFNLKI